MRAAAALRAAAVDTGRPVFLAPAGGVGRMIAALADALGDAPADRLRSPPSRPRAQVLRRARRRVADAVVLAAPAFATAPLLSPLPPGGRLPGRDRHGVGGAMALAVPAPGSTTTWTGPGSWCRQRGPAITACSWVTSKWTHLGVDPSLALLRASVGRDGDDRALTLADDALVAAVLDDLATTMGVKARRARSGSPAGPARSPSPARVTWPRSLMRRQPWPASRPAWRSPAPGRGAWASPPASGVVGPRPPKS